MFQGTDYTTEQPDLHKLIRHLKNNHSGSLLKYFTNEKSKVRALVFTSSQMRKQYLKYKDLLCVAQVPSQALSELRVDL